jgi:hypothetical protein
VSQFSDKALQVLKTVAPTLALAVGGPFGSIAAAAINAALGTTDPKAADAALVNATPDQLLEIKKAEQDFQVQMRQLGIAEEKLAFDDTANARGREIAVKDKTPMILAFVITLGFFGTLLFMLFKGTPSSGGEALLVLLGSLATAWAGVVTYFFGSSAGSATKDKTISDIAKQS